MNLKVSKIYRTVKVNEPFKDWLNREKQNYAIKVESGKINPNKYDFDTWINMKYASGLKENNAIGEDITDIFNKTAELLKGKESKPVSPTVATSPNVKKTILGLDPIIAYSLLGSTLAIVGFVIYKKIKK